MFVNKKALCKRMDPLQDRTETPTGTYTRRMCRVFSDPAINTHVQCVPLGHVRLCVGHVRLFAQEICHVHSLQRKTYYSHKQSIKPCALFPYV